MPGLAALRRYRFRSDFSHDLFAGLSVAAVALPVSIAYAELAGLSPATGLYASIGPLLVYALFGTSPQLMVNPDAASCAILAAAVAPLAGGDPALYLSLATALTLFTGVLCVLASAFRLGALADFLSKPILVGFLNGIALSIFLGQIGKVLGFQITASRIVPRLIEILSNIPFLFVVMIASTAIPEGLKETAGLWIIIGILLLFGWMGMTYLMRTAALKEKARDYIAASRVIGASTPRILFRHLLPNSVAIIVTLVPFSISSLVLALTSLDYLGFGLPAKYATWGQLLRDGLENLSAPWLVTSAFLVLVGLLILITFVGEAVREAFDPKKFSYYR